METSALRRTPGDSLLAPAVYQKGLTTERGWGDMASQESSDKEQQRPVPLGTLAGSFCGLVAGSTVHPARGAEQSHSYSQSLVFSRTLPSCVPLAPALVGTPPPQSQARHQGRPEAESQPLSHPLLQALTLEASAALRHPPKWPPQTQSPSQSQSQPHDLVTPPSKQRLAWHHARLSSLAEGTTPLRVGTPGTGPVTPTSAAASSVPSLGRLLQSPSPSFHSSLEQGAPVLPSLSCFSLRLPVSSKTASELGGIGTPVSFPPSCPASPANERAHSDNCVAASGALWATASLRRFKWQSSSSDTRGCGIMGATEAQEVNAVNAAEPGCTVETTAAQVTLESDPTRRGPPLLPSVGLGGEGGPVSDNLADGAPYPAANKDSEMRDRGRVGEPGEVRICVGQEGLGGGSRVKCCLSFDSQSPAIAGALAGSLGHGSSEPTQGPADLLARRRTVPELLAGRIEATDLCPDSSATVPRQALLRQQHPAGDMSLQLVADHVDGREVCVGSLEKGYRGFNSASKGDMFPGQTSAKACSGGEEETGERVRRWQGEKGETEGEKKFDPYGMRGRSGSVLCDWLGRKRPRAAASSWGRNFEGPVGPQSMSPVPGPRLSKAMPWCTDKLVLPSRKVQVVVGPESTNLADGGNCSGAMLGCARTPTKEGGVLHGYTKTQTEGLERSFRQRRVRTPRMTEGLAKALRMHPRQVAFWYENRRVQWRKDPHNRLDSVVHQGCTQALGPAASDRRLGGVPGSGGGASRGTRGDPKRTRTKWELESGSLSWRPCKGQQGSGFSRFSAERWEFEDWRGKLGKVGKGDIVGREAEAGLKPSVGAQEKPSQAKKLHSHGDKASDLASLEGKGVPELVGEGGLVLNYDHASKLTS